VATAVGAAIILDAVTLLSVSGLRHSIVELKGQLDAQQSSLAALTRLQALTLRVAGQTNQEVGTLRPTTGPTQAAERANSGAKANEAAASNTNAPDKETAGQSPADDEVRETVAKARSFIENALQTGRWTETDKMTLRAYLPTLPANEAGALLNSVITAYNQQRLKLDGHMPLF
jgi:hypothetical protein